MGYGSRQIGTPKRDFWDRIYVSMFLCANLAMPRFPVSLKSGIEKGLTREGRQDMCLILRGDEMK